MIECKNCGSKLSRVSNTYHKEITFRGVTRSHIRRRRQCRHCVAKYITVEIVEQDDPEPQPEAHHPVRESHRAEPTGADHPEPPFNPFL